MNQRLVRVNAGMKLFEVAKHNTGSSHSIAATNDVLSPSLQWSIRALDSVQEALAYDVSPIWPPPCTKASRAAVPATRQAMQ